MNERIQELAEQAMAKAVAKNFTGDKLELRMPSEAWAKEFTELIVKECAELLWTEECYNSDLALEEFEKNSKKIKQHFGVEE